MRRISMISLSYISPLADGAFASAALIYFASAYLFKKPAWIHRPLHSAHDVPYTINPSGGPTTSPSSRDDVDHIADRLLL
jgi:hypothetical protein